MFQAQAAEYERQLSEHVAELKASLLKTQAANREKELLDARHKERFQVCVLHSCESSRLVSKRAEESLPDFRYTRSLHER